MTLRVWALLLILMVLASAGIAQNISGVINGTVKDPAGAVVAGADVTLRNQATGVAQTTKSNEAGLFVFSSVLPGTYTLEVSTAGFRTFQVRDVALTANERRSLGEI